MRLHREHHKTRAAANLQEVSRPQCRDAGHRIRDVLAHVGIRKR
jgi:hypothetical protein